MRTLLRFGDYGLALTPPLFAGPRWLLCYFVCAVGRACVYEDGYERIMAALKAAPRPVTVTFGIPS